MAADLGPLDPDSASGVAPGMTLGSYRVERLLGRGGMGAVFLAYDTTLHRYVALKVMDAADTETSRARLLREARNAAALNHPNICTIHEVGDANAATFIAMEYVEGRSLRERLDEGKLPLEDGLQYGAQAAEALMYAHDHGVIHRDFKAANAIVTPEGWLKVVDFGLARRADEALMHDATTMASLVPVGTQAGTPYAMAPEQVRGEAADRRTDIWALGILLHEMAGGDKPFRGATVPELYSSILRDAPIALPGHVPVELRAVIARCLDKDPAKRFSHAREVRAALTAIQAGAVSPWLGWRDRVMRNKWGLATAALLLVTGAAVGLNLGGVRDRLVRGAAQPTPLRLAVLPFENLTGDPDQEYFSDGLTEEMITQLGRLQPQHLSVIARSSSMQYKNRNTPIDQIGRELGVDYLLEGSARREGSRVRISATLIQVRDQTQRWADTFERELAGILALQSDVAQGVAKSLAITLLPAEQNRLASARTVNPEAYEAYLMGRSHQSKLTRADMDTAQRYFELALEKDHNYALAYLGIAAVWSGRQQMGFVPPSEAAPRMKVAVAKAIELDSDLPDIHSRLAGQTTWTDWNWAAAEPEFRRALEVLPNDAEVRAFYSHYLYIMKRPSEAVEQIRRALELDPLSLPVQTLYGRDLVHARRFDEAVLQFQKVLRTNPNSPQALNNLAEVYYILRRYDDALAAERTRFKARGDAEIEQALTRGQAESGYPGAIRQAAEALADRSRTTHVPPVDLAGLFLRAGQHDRALDWLERSFETRDPMLPYISAHPIYDSIRADARFQLLLRRMNLPN
jgi:serine/threonine protein kinase/Tfp pilus assembly protein PilF